MSGVFVVPPNFKHELVTFCGTQDFKTYVRAAINDELFWRDMFNKMSVNDMVRRELDNKIPSIKNDVVNEARHIATNTANNVANDKLNNYSQYQLPGHIAKALQDQVTSYLNNNVQMNQILTNHSQSLNQQLYATAQEILAKLVAEPQFQQIQIAHTHQMTLSFNEFMEKIRISANQQLDANTNQFKVQMSDMQKQVKEELKTISEANRRLDDLSDKLVKTINNVHKLEEQNNSLSLSMKLMGTLLLLVSGGFGIFLASHK
jgi:DNA anti-recombination protein RmuC